MSYLSPRPTAVRLDMLGYMFSGSNSSTSSGFDTTPTDVTADTMSNIVSTNDADISSGDITSSEYARKGRELMKLANDLRAMGYAVLLLPLLVI